MNGLASRLQLAYLQKHAREIGVGEFEVAFVVELQESRTVRMVLLEMKVMDLRLGRGMTAVFAHVHLKMDKEKRDVVINGQSQNWTSVKRPHWRTNILWMCMLQKKSMRPVVKRCCLRDAFLWTVCSFEAKINSKGDFIVCFEIGCLNVIHVSDILPWIASVCSRIDERHRGPSNNGIPESIVA